MDGAWRMDDRAKEEEKGYEGMRSCRGGGIGGIGGRGGGRAAYDVDECCNEACEKSEEGWNATSYKSPDMEWWTKEGEPQ